MALDNFARIFKDYQKPSDQDGQNDDKLSLYTTEELYNDVYKRIDIPVVFDYHHHDLHSGGSPRKKPLTWLFTWPVDVRPVVHYSESRSDEYGDPKIKPQAHSDSYVDLLTLMVYQWTLCLRLNTKSLHSLKCVN